LAAVAWAIAGMMGVAWLVLYPRAVPAGPTLELAEVLRVDGRLVRLAATNEVFTGWITERHPDGNLKSRSRVENGLLQGMSEGWYAKGQIQVREHFAAGLAEGLRVKWHANGATQSVATMVRGQVHGRFLRWHENGTLSEEVPMESGQPDGLSRAYYPSGFVKAEVRLKAGQVLEQRFWKDGEMPAASGSLAATAAHNRRAP
jgi:antitoxin component YwqK of YwqJK toxin-antitoxin module